MTLHRRPCLGPLGLIGAVMATAPPFIVVGASRALARHEIDDLFGELTDDIVTVGDNFGSVSDAELNDLRTELLRSFHLDDGTEPVLSFNDEVGYYPKPEDGDGRRHKRRRPVEGDIRPLMCGHISSARHRPLLC